MALLKPCINNATLSLKRGRSKDVFDFLKNSRLNVIDIHAKILYTLQQIEWYRQWLRNRKRAVPRSKFSHMIEYHIDSQISWLDKYPTPTDFLSMRLLSKYDGDIYSPLKRSEADFFFSCIPAFPFEVRSSREEIKCCGEIDVNDHEYICQGCGKVLGSRSIGLNGLTYKELSEKMIKSPPVYNHTNHLREKINQKLSRLEKESIPEPVMESVREQLRRDRIEDVSALKPGDVRKILKKLGLVKYYSYDYSIFTRLTGTVLINFDDNLVQKLESMFDSVKEVFVKIKDKRRKSMFVYDYTIHKLLEILELHNYKQFFKPPKDSDKIAEYDRLWKKICAELNWKFVSTQRI